MKRREFITLLGGAAAWPVAARAQQRAKLPTIGFLGSGTAAAQSQWTAAFVQRLRELGWSEGRNVAIEYRWGEGRSERFAEIAAEFVLLKVDVILTHNTPLAAKQATSVIPIVFASAGDPVGTGVVASLARPGGNVTGLSAGSTDVVGKRLELLREVMPGLRRLAILASDSPHLVQENAPSLSKSPRLKSGESKISRPRSRRSRAARTRFTLSPTRSQSATECASIRWRWARDCRRCTVSGNPSKQAV